MIVLSLDDFKNTESGVPQFMMDCYISHEDWLKETYGQSAESSSRIMGFHKWESDIRFHSMVELYMSEIVAVTFPTIATHVLMSTTYSDWNDSIFIYGETGTGKELLAKYIFKKCLRKREKKCKTMATINCAAIPENLIESILFGHKKGSFSDAIADHTGLFEDNANGVVFLDEISHLSLPAQGKLLRFLETKDFYRVGEGIRREADVQIISATNVDLWPLIEKGDFLGDLYFRLSGCSVNIPNLAERHQNDKKVLVTFFILKEMKTIGMEKIEIPDEFFNTICAAPYKGNIREMKMACKRLVHFYRSVPGNNSTMFYSLFYSQLSPATQAAILNHDELRAKTDQPLSNDNINGKTKMYFDLLEMVPLKVAKDEMLRRFNKDWLDYQNKKHKPRTQKELADIVGMDKAEISKLKKLAKSSPGFFLS